MNKGAEVNTITKPDARIVANAEALCDALVNIVNAYDNRFGTPMGNYVGPIDEEITAARNLLLRLA